VDGLLGCAVEVAADKGVRAHRQQLRQLGAQELRLRHRRGAAGGRATLARCRPSGFATQNRALTGAWCAITERRPRGGPRLGLPHRDVPRVEVQRHRPEPHAAPSVQQCRAYRATRAEQSFARAPLGQIPFVIFHSNQAGGRVAIGMTLSPPAAGLRSARRRRRRPRARRRPDGRPCRGGVRSHSGAAL
jgi:hypothetical protein